MPADEQHACGDDAKRRKPDPEHAIDHRVRREILRELLGAPEPMTVKELAELVPTANVSSLGYHVLVLEREACIRRAGEITLSNGVLPTYAATIADNLFVMGMLEASRQADERR